MVEYRYHLLKASSLDLKSFYKTKPVLTIYFTETWPNLRNLKKNLIIVYIMSTKREKTMLTHINRSTFV